MSCRFVFPSIPSVALTVALTAAVVLSQGLAARGQAVGNPNAGNGWNSTGGVQVYSSSGDAGGREIVHMIDGSGMSGDYGQYAAGGTAIGQMALSRNLDGVGNPNPNYVGSAEPGTVQGSHWIEFQFDQAYQLGTTWLWNWNETGSGYDGPSFGWKDLNVQYSADGVSWNTAYAGVLPKAPGAGGATPQLIFDFGGATAQFVVLTNTGLGNDQNWGAAATLGDNFDAGLSEIRFWLQGATLPSFIPGDINSDGQVNLTDYGVLTSHWLQSVTANSNGDLNGDGTVNIQDFGLFKQDYNAFNGAGSGAALAAVPEPGTLVLLACALPSVFVVRRLRRKLNIG